MKVLYFVDVDLTYITDALGHQQEDLIFK